MGFLETVASAKRYLREHGRVSVRGLKREFVLEDITLAELVEELVDVQRVAARTDDVLSWIGADAVQTRAEPFHRPIAAADGERRQLTLMFCDLVDSTALSQHLDAEDLRNVVRAYQDAAATAIARYAGYIAQYLGDGLLVYFGYPQAHEDDAERAVRAGREVLTAIDTLNDTLESQYGIRISARLGIHTGTVVVGEMGAPGRKETLALGDAANIAARLEGLAEPDSIVVSEATLRLVPGLFVTQDLGTPQLKGIREPPRAFAVLRSTGVRSRLHGDPSRLTPLVGRGPELARLLERWERARAGSSQAVLISGEAGLGKSRLLQAFRERLSGEPHGWLECRCSSYTQGSAFYPLIELLGQGLGFKERDAPDAKLLRLERGISAAGLSPREVVPLIAPFLSLPHSDRYAPAEGSAELQRRQTIDALVAWIVALGERQPLVMLCEDLHWCDPSTVEFLGVLLERTNAGLLTLLTFRQEFEPPWTCHPHQIPLMLERLSRSQVESMIDRMQGKRRLARTIVERIAARADGIPLFVEEITKMVLESDPLGRGDDAAQDADFAELAIPATLQDSLMARLDRLPEGKEVAQLGSALGREFLDALLRGVSTHDVATLDRGLDQLVAAELLYRRGAPPEASYAFKHAMVQDTAYRSLLKSARQQLHARIARVLEERFPQRVDSEPEVIAHHYDEAGLPVPAIAHYQRAGARAATRSANEEAIRQLRRALDLLATLPETPERKRRELELQLAIGAPLSSARGWADPECEAAYGRARELASQIGDVVDLPQILVGLSVSYYSKGDLAASAELAGEALEAAERRGDSIDLLASHSVVGVAHYWQGEFDQAIRHFEQVHRLYDPALHASHAKMLGGDRGVLSRAYSSWCQGFLGYPDRALSESEEALALAAKVQDPYSSALALAWSGVLHFLRRERELTHERADSMTLLGDRLGIPLLQGLGKVYRGWALTVSPAGEGVDELQQGLRELARHATGIGAPSMLAMLAEVFWKVGRHDDAQGALAIAVMRAQEKGQHYYDAELNRLRGEILLDQQPDAWEEPKQLFERALEISGHQRTKFLELRAAASLARLHECRGDVRAAREVLAPVYGWFTEGFGTPNLEEARTLLDRMH